MAVDIVIKNCKVVRPEGISAEGIAVSGDKIVAITDDSHLPEADRVIDAQGNYVIPGVIDNHCHPGYAHSLEEDTLVDSAAAAYGGVTTMAIMIGGGAYYWTDSYLEVYEKWQAAIQANTYTNFLLNPMFFGPAQVEEMLPFATKYGIPQFKMLLIGKLLANGKIGGTDSPLGTVSCDDGMIYKALKNIVAIGPPARMLFHCENADVIFRIDSALQPEERKKNQYAVWAETRPGWAEALDVTRASSIAKVVGAPIYIVHLSSAAGVEAVAEAKAKGVDIYAETCPSYLTLTKYHPLNSIAKVIPPFRDEASIERMWEALKMGIVECLGTDNISAETKNKQNIWTALGGNPGVEHLLPIMLSEGVNKGRISLEKLVQIACANNAKAMGIYPRKGVIRVGSDADLVIVDLNKKVKLSAETDHQLSDYCLWEGWEVRGYPVFTLIGGKVVVENGKLVGKPGTGKYLARYSRS